MKNVIPILFKLVKNKAILIVLLLTAQSALAHEGHHTKQAWHACETKEIGASCGYIMQTNLLFKGSCRQMSQALMCVRNKPIITLSDKELNELVTESLSKIEGKR